MRVDPSWRKPKGIEYVGHWLITTLGALLRLAVQQPSAPEVQGPGGYVSSIFPVTPVHDKETDKLAMQAICTCRDYKHTSNDYIEWRGLMRAGRLAMARTRKLGT
jgi:hypothetical protein